MKRLARISYLFFVAAFAGAGIGVLVFNLVEGSAGSVVSEGRVLDRIEGERTVTNCSGRPRSCRTTVYPTYTVVGERDDGSTWLVVGEGPWHAMRGERGAISVTTSDTTGRVVGLGGQDDSWRFPSGGYVAGSAGFLVFWAALVAAYEHARRTGRWTMGAFQGAEPVIAVPGVLSGLGLAGYLMLGPAWGLDVVSTVDAQQTFIADPFAYADEQFAADERDEPGIQVNEPFRAGGTQLTVVGGEHLEADTLAAWQSIDDMLTIPLLRVGEPTGQFNRTTFDVLVDGESVAPIDCPSTVLAFPSAIGASDSFGGFVCFDAAAIGGEFRVIVGTVRISEVKAHPAYQLPEGTIIEADRS